MRLYFKCVLFGLLGVVIAVGSSLFGVIVWASLKARGGSWSFVIDPVSFLRSSVMPWIVMLTAFGSGFFWRLSKARR